MEVALENSFRPLYFFCQNFLRARAQIFETDDYRQGSNREGCFRSSLSVALGSRAEVMQTATVLQDPQNFQQEISPILHFLASCK